MSSKDLRRERGGWAAAGLYFYVWQEDEIAARDWLEVLGRDSHGRPRKDPRSRGKMRGADAKVPALSPRESTDWRNTR